ncbi:hypothetical protein V8E55_009602 [Tylopilus felleus]
MVPTATGPNGGNLRVQFTQCRSILVTTTARRWHPYRSRSLSGRGPHQRWHMGVAYSFLCEFFPPAPQFTVDSVPDLSGKVVLVTGANAGIGKETARVLLTKNANVWIACRDRSKGEATLRELKQLTGRDAHLLQLDLANLRSIKQSVDDFLQRENQLHILFNNACVWHF